MLDVERSMLNVRCWMLVVGCWMFGVESVPLLEGSGLGHSALEVRCSMFDVRCWMLDCWIVGLLDCWMFDVGSPHFPCFPFPSRERSGVGHSPLQTRKLR